MAGRTYSGVLATRSTSVRSRAFDMSLVTKPSIKSGGSVSRLLRMRRRDIVFRSQRRWRWRRNGIVERWLIVISTAKSIPVHGNQLAAGVCLLTPLQMTINREQGYAIESISIPVSCGTGTTPGISAIFLREAKADMLPYLDAIFAIGP